MRRQANNSSGIWYIDLERVDSEEIQIVKSQKGIVKKLSVGSPHRKRVDGNTKGRKVRQVGERKTYSDCENAMIGSKNNVFALVTMCFGRSVMFFDLVNCCEEEGIGKIAECSEMVVKTYVCYLSEDLKPSSVGLRRV
jgi:hypothetical protein